MQSHRLVSSLSKHSTRDPGVCRVEIAIADAFRKERTRHESTDAASAKTVHNDLVLLRLGLPGHLHTFRHSFISHALTEGTPEAIMRQWVGHVDRDIIRQYTHIADTASQAAMQRLSRGENSNLQQTDQEVTNEKATDSDSAQIQHNRSGDANGRSAK